LVLGTGARSVIDGQAACARYAPTGHVVFERHGRLEAVRFSLTTLSATDETERSRLCEELPSDVRPRGAERAPDGEFLAAARPAGKHEVREIRAGHDQYQRDECDQCQADPPPGVVLLARRYRANAPRAFARLAEAATQLGKCEIKVAPNGCELRGGSDFRNAVPQFANHDQLSTITR